MKRSVYEAPTVERIQIRMEGGFCSGSADIENSGGTNGGISEQEVNDGFTTNFAGNESTNVWD